MSLETPSNENAPGEQSTADDQSNVTNILSDNANKLLPGSQPPYSNETPAEPTPDTQPPPTTTEAAEPAPSTVISDGKSATPAANAGDDDASNAPKPPSAPAPKGKKGRKGSSKASNRKGKPNKQLLENLKKETNEKVKEKANIDKKIKELQDEDKNAQNDIEFLVLQHDELMRQQQIAQQELQDLEIRLANKEREIEEIKEVSASELKVYQRKVKHLMAANQNDFAQNYIQNERMLYQQRQEQQLESADPERIANALKSDTNDLQLQDDTLMTNHRMQQDRLFTELREEFERQAEAKRAMHDQRVRAMRNQLEEQRQQETSELEHRKNTQIEELQAKNAKAFDNIKRYFNNITHNNIELIKQNKTKISKKKTEINAIRKEVDELNAQRKKLEAPLNELKEENERLRKEKEVYQQEKLKLARNKKKIKVLEDELRDLQLAQEVLEQRFEQLEQERDGLYDQFETSIHDVRQKTEFRAYVLEQKVKRLHEELEQKEMQLQQVMQEAGLDATAISAKIDDVLAVKNAKINQLEVELAKVQKAHNDILTVYEQKMAKFGIPKEELGFSAMPEHPEYCDDASIDDDDY